MVENPHELIHVAHPDVDGTAVVPRSSLPHMVGWEEVDAPETGPTSDAYDHELIEVIHPGIEGTAQVLRSSLGQMDGEWRQVSDEDDVDLEELKKPDLKAEAEKRGLSTSGTKAELADAITAHDEQVSQDTQPADEATLEEK